MLCIGLYIDCSDELYDDHCVHCLGICIQPHVMIVNVYALYESQLLGQVKSNGRGSSQPKLARHRLKSEKNDMKP